MSFIEAETAALIGTVVVSMSLGMSMANKSLLCVVDVSVFVALFSVVVIVVVVGMSVGVSVATEDHETKKV